MMLAQSGWTVVPDERYPARMQQMIIPKTWRETFAAYLFIPLFAAFILFFVVLAARNILAGEAIVGSCIWLLLVVGIMVSVLWDEGISHFLVNILGAFAKTQFIQRSEAPNPEIWFGFRLLGINFYYLKVEARKIRFVSWRAGQASDRAGRDLNDWMVVLRFDAGDTPRGSYIVMSEASKEETEAFGRDFITFLHDAGVDLVEDDNRGILTFRRPHGSIVNNEEM